MTNEEFTRFEKLVRTNRVFWIRCDREPTEVFRVELFDNGQHGTWVDTFARNCQGSCSLKDYKLSDFEILEPITLT